MQKWEILVLDIYVSKMQIPSRMSELCWFAFVRCGQGYHNLQNSRMSAVKLHVSPIFEAYTGNPMEFGISHFHHCDVVTFQPRLLRQHFQENAKGKISTSVKQDLFNFNLENYDVISSKMALSKQFMFTVPDYFFNLLPAARRQVSFILQCRRTGRYKRSNFNYIGRLSSSRWLTRWWHITKYVNAVEFSCSAIFSARLVYAI